MKYFEVNFSISAPEALMQDARDILSALAGEAGFETFEETEEGLIGYVQQSLFDKELLNTMLCDFPFEDADVSYEVREAEDRDWNEQWEQEGFEPIVVRNDESQNQKVRNDESQNQKVRNDESQNQKVSTIIIHDGRHLPEEDASTPLPQTSLSIEIDAHLAFGTGTHQTTRMMVSSLLEIDLKDKRILDCGCGTGILGITALKLGAKECVGYDIDEWSTDNARHNAVINQVDDRFTSLLGDATILNSVEETFDVVMANINRNILLSDMASFHNKMKKGATLLLSGFYLEDIPILQEKAAEISLTLVAQKSEENWACLKLQ